MMISRREIAPTNTASNDSSSKNNIRTRTNSAAWVNHIRVVIRIPEKINGIIIGKATKEIK